MRRVKRGFTLIELLVVIAIIAILAGLLFPVFAKARDKARQTSCFNNEKQIGMALRQYLDDWDGGLPGYHHNEDPTRGYFRLLLQPYLKSEEVWVCPSDSCPSGAYMIRDSNGQLRRERRSYLPNAQVIGPGDSQSGGQGLAPDRGAEAETEIVEPSQTIAIAEKRTGWADWHLDFPQDVLPPYGGEHSLEKQRHNGGSNYIFADGHVKWMTFAQTMMPRLMWVRNPAYWRNRFASAKINNFNDDERGRPEPPHFDPCE